MKVSIRWMMVLALALCVVSVAWATSNEAVADSATVENEQLEATPVDVGDEASNVAIEAAPQITPLSVGISTTVPLLRKPETSFACLPGHPRYCVSPSDCPVGCDCVLNCCSD